MPIATLTEAIHKAVETRGRDYVYVKPGGPGDTSTCYNRDPETGEPSCLLGVALDLMGLLPSKEVLEARDRYLMFASLGEIVAAFELDSVISPAEVEAGGGAQGTQDRGENWGTALDTYDRLVAERQP